MWNNEIVSIITVVYNGEANIENTIRNVLNQTYTDIEYIVIDGASSDNTVNIIKRYSDKISFWLSEPDEGIYDAMNKGINLAHGKWIMFINAGDTFESSSTVADVFNLYDQFNDADIVFGDINLITNNQVKLLKQNKKQIAFESICHQSQIIKLETLKRYYYNINFKIYADYDFQLKIFENDKSKIKYIPLTIANYDTSGVSALPFYKFLFQFKKVVDSNVRPPRKYLFYFQAIIFSIKSILYPFVLLLKSLR